MSMVTIKRALLSVADKTGLLEFAQALAALNIEIISSGGTSECLRSAGIPHKQLEEVTGFQEMLGGRVKTLHPKIHGGILGKRDQHADEAKQHQIDWIDLVVVNFYPFEEAWQKGGLDFAEAIEYIDIGGPTMVRGAAKNSAFVGVVVDPNDYGHIVTRLREQNGLDFNIRKQLAEKAFAMTAHYDAVIHAYFQQESMKNCHASESWHPDNSIEETWMPAFAGMTASEKMPLRYGENPHQKAYAFQNPFATAGILSAVQHQGKPLSYNNILDAEAAALCVSEFNDPTCVIVKHATPCAVASTSMIDQAYKQAYAADSTSAFGGVVALNRACNKETAAAIVATFMEVIIAPDYSDEAKILFATKPNLRVLQLSLAMNEQWEKRFITGGMLLQEKDKQIINSQDLQIMTETKPNESEIAAMLFAWKVVKHIKSNAIVIAKDRQTIGIGGGQVSRIDAVEMAVNKARDQINGAVLASDAFFPFRDSIDRLCGLGLRAIIQPGGSLRDAEVIAACNEHDIAMVFTGKRCFRH